MPHLRQRQPVLACLYALGLLWALSGGYSTAQTEEVTVANCTQRTLDFLPFEYALAGLSADRIADLDAFLATAAIPDIQAAMAEQRFGAEDLVLYYVGRIQRYDAGQLNAILELNPDALGIARALDAERAAGAVRGPLHGIPVLLKDNIATGDGLHTSAAAAVMRDAYADRDAFIVSQLRAAGAVILGKANMTEWAGIMGPSFPPGFSVLGGQSRNPYGAGFSTGGSSAGSAVAVAANLVTVAIGTETQGSISSPASSNSLVGLKPSLGLVSRDHIIPITAYQDTAGPLARSVTDMAILLTALAVADSADPAALDAAPLAGRDFTAYLDPDGLRGLRVGLVRMTINDEENVLLDRAVTTLRDAGADVIPLALPQPELNVTPVLLHGMRSDLHAYLEATNAPVKTLAEIVAYNEQDPQHCAPQGQAHLIDALALPQTNDDIAALAAANRDHAAAAIHDALMSDDLDVLLTVANRFAGVYAPAGFPALIVPAGYTQDGQPFGLTFVGDFLSEPTLIAAAYAFEQEAQARVNPVLD